MTDEESNTIHLEDTFSLHNHPRKVFLLKLSSLSLSITSKSNDNSTEIIPIEDIYGCLCMKSTQNSIPCHLTIYLYSLNNSKGFFSSKSRLYRTQRTYTYAIYDDYEKNYAEVIRWHRYIKHAIYLQQNLPQDIVKTQRDKRVLVFVNPAGGAGKAYRLVMQHAVGVWSEAEFNHLIVVTEYAGHAKNYVQELDLNEWSGVVVASGDGLVYEVINGLLSRNDWREAMKLPIGHLPCGSGNAFITSIIRYAKQSVADSMEKYVVQSAILVATHQVLPFDMALIDICDGQTVFSFLSVEWAIIADVDCDSEKYRYLGGARFTVEALKRIARPRIYEGYIDYLPYEPTDPISPIKSDVRSPNQLHQRLIPLNEPISTDPTTSKWRRIEGPFTHVLITSKSALSNDVIAAPQSTLADGYLTLQYISVNGSTRTNLAKTFLSLENGKHLDYDFVQCLHVTAFRIVPKGTDGNMTVDGEKVPYGPIQGEILPKFARCMAKQPRTTTTSSASASE